ncbi:MAG: MBL fold metallo-hydrolase [Alphaproteobacteria bacterium]
MSTTTDIALPDVMVLGTGGPWVSADRFGPATLIRHGNERLLFDTGRGVGIRMVEAGEDPARVNPIFITHHHLDHISDLADVMITSWLRGRQDDLLIYGPAGTAEIVDTLITKVYAKDIEWRSVGEPIYGGWKPVRAIDIEPGDVIETGTWRVTCAYAVHGHGLDFSKAFKNRWKCLSYRFEAAGKIITVSGDTVDCGGLRRMAEGADILVQCCFAGAAEIGDSEHMRKVATFTLADAVQAARVATACGVGHLVLTHLRPKSAAELKALEAEVRAIYDGPLTIGRDMTAVAIPAA